MSEIGLERFEYVELPALRFIGVDAWRGKEDWGDLWKRKALFLPALEEKRGSISPLLPHLAAFMHHDDGEVDVVNRFVVGYFFEAGTVVPNGYDFCDLRPQSGAYAAFAEMPVGDLWRRYECARDKILSEGRRIPYPVGYWHCEIYPDKAPYFEDNCPPVKSAVLFPISNS